MAIDLHWRLSGGASNTDPNGALGGAIASTAVGINLFHDLTGPQGLAGHTDYRCIYLRNSASSTDTANIKLYISDLPPIGTTISLGLGTSAVNGTEPTTADELTAPSGVTFTAPTSADAGLAIALTPGQTKAFWIRRATDAGTSGAGLLTILSAAFKSALAAINLGSYGALGGGAIGSPPLIAAGAVADVFANLSVIYNIVGVAPVTLTTRRGSRLARSSYMRYS